jgi:PHD/YefM family antitoxin component YafN of YafNO toxin-antitoxin module
MITKKGKKVAVVIPMEEFKQEREEGLIKAEGALAGLEDSIDEMVNLIYEAREKEMSREVNL